MQEELVALDVLANVVWPLVKPRIKKLRGRMKKQAWERAERRFREAMESVCTREWFEYTGIDSGLVHHGRLCNAVLLTAPGLPEDADRIKEPELRRAARAINWLDRGVAYQSLRQGLEEDYKAAVLAFYSSRALRDYVDRRFLEDRRFTDDSCPGYIGNRFASNHDGG